MSPYVTMPLVFEGVPEAEMLPRAEAFLARMRKRRTVRDYADRPVPRELIEAAVRVAGTAPSGANQQPWTFVCISDPERKKLIREGAEEEERAFYAGRAGEEWLDALAHLGTDDKKPFLETAPWLIAIFAQRWGFDAQGNKVKHYYVPKSVGIATGFLIAALRRRAGDADAYTGADELPQPDLRAARQREGADPARRRLPEGGLPRPRHRQETAGGDRDLPVIPTR